MAIVQISKIQQRSGNLVDLPQLDEAEFGFASDEKRLFIGKTNSGIENIEVLTSYSTVDFSQLNGAYGNLDINITSNTASGANGQVLAFDGNNWVNRGGNAGGLITLGTVSNVKITGGAIDYVLTTDGTGNLAWTPKATITAYIENAESALLSMHQTYATDTYSANSVITIGNTSGYTSGLAIQFTGTAFGNLSVGNTFYVRNVISNTAFTISDTANLTANFTLTNGSGNLTVNLLGTVVTTTEDNFLVEGAQVTITSAVGMTELNGNSYYIDILSANTFALYTDPLFASPVDSSAYNSYAYTSVTATTASTNYVTVGDTTAFSQYDPVIFLGTTFGGIFANQTYYIANIVSSTQVRLSFDEAGSNIVTLTTATGTANMYVPGGRVICAVSGGGISNAGGTQYSIQYNNSNLLDGDANFTYDDTTKLLTLTGGNANVGNLNATGIVTATRIFSNIGTGVAPPFVVTSTDRVANLNVSYANVSDFEVVTTQTTGTFYPVFVNGNSTANYALGSNSALAFNALTGNLSTTNLNVNANANVGNIGAGIGVFTGNITSLNANLGNLAVANFVTGTLTTVSNAQPNLTSFGNGTQVTVAGNLNPNANVTYNLGNTTNRWNALYLSGSTIYLGNATITSSPAGVVITNASGGSFTVGGTSAANGAAIVNGNSSVIVTANSNVNISSNGVANVLVVTNTGANITGTANITGNANVGNIGATSGVFTGTVSVTGNANVGNIGATSGVLTGTLSVTGNANVGNIGATSGVLTGTLSVTGNANIGNIGTGGLIVATGNITGGNLSTAGSLAVTGNGNIGTLRVSGTSNLGPIGNVTITGGSANQLLKTNGSGTLSWTDPTGGYYLHTQGAASTTWTITHNLNNQYISVEPIDNTGNSYVGRYDYPVVNYTNANVVTLTFSSAVTGYCAVVGGGFNYANGPGNTTPAGLNTYVQFNDAGVLGGQPSLTFDKTTGTLNATLFAGSGANITNINASNISNGTLPSARLSGTYTITVSGSATTAGTVTTAAQPNITSLGTLTSLGVNGTITGVNITANTGVFTGNGSGLTSLTGANVTGTVSSATTAGTVTTAAQPNITSVGTLSSLAVTGNISGANLTGTHYGAATGLTSIPGANVTGTVANATYAISAGSATTATTATSATTAGTVTTAAQPNITSVGTLTGLTVSGATSVTGNSAFTVTNITSGANTTLGYITGNWTLTTGSRMQATYADLAEYYSADEHYSPGTVLEFGGREEVTLATDATNRVAGVVSTDPAYAMNAKCPGEHPVAIALQGRVPCKVRGKIRKGDMLISGGGGYARPTTTPMIGTVIGKALQDFEGVQGVIEVAVGRL